MICSHSNALRQGTKELTAVSNNKVPSGDNMKIRICEKCQFRSLLENKICRTCGGREFVDYETAEKVESESIHIEDWKDLAFKSWNALKEMGRRWNSTIKPSTVEDESRAQATSK